MSTTVILVRHARHALLDRALVGRMPSVPLSLLGMREADALAGHDVLRRCASVHSSPQQRALETARPIAAAAGCDVEIAGGFDEIHMGEWTGRTFSELEGEPRWQRWNSHRSITRPPGGESMADLQERAFDHLARLRARFHDHNVAVVSHAEPIRAVLLALKRIPIDGFTAIRIDPASMTILRFTRGAWRIVQENVIAEAVVAA